MPPPQDFTLDIPIFAKLYDFYKNLSQALMLFPKNQRFTLGQQLDSLTLGIFELLFSIQGSGHKVLLLEQTSSKLDLLKVLLRLAKDTKSLSNNNYLQLQSSLQEIGKMLGGWIRAAKHNSP